MVPALFQIALRRRLRLPLPMRPRWCGDQSRPGCGHEMDAYGDHEAACPVTGLLGRRGRGIERAWIRVAREAVAGEGQVIPQQWMANIAAQDVEHDDRRRLDLVIYGASPAGHVLCCDATLVSPLTRTGRPIPRAAAHNGAAIRRAEDRKRRTYPELCGTRAQRLRVLASEIGGRWSDDCIDLMKLLVQVRARRAPRFLRRSAAVAWKRRWWSILSIAVQTSLASTLEHPANWLPRDAGGFEEPCLTDVLLHAEVAPSCSLLGPH